MTVIKPISKMAYSISKTSAVIKDKITDFEATPNSISANFGNILHSRPTILPTKALTMIKMVNCFQFSFRPSLTASDMLV